MADAVAQETEPLIEKRVSGRFCLPKWRERFLLGTLLTAQFATLCTDTFLFPFFPHEAKSKGLESTEIGLVFSSFELTRFAASPVAGYLMGRISPKTLCLVGTAMLSATCISFGAVTYAADEVYLPLCILIRLVAGCGAATLAVALMTTLLKATSYSTATIVCLVEVLQGGGYAVGPAIGAALNQVGGYMCMFWTIGCFMGLLCIVEVFAIPVIESKKVSKTSSLQMARIPGIMLLTTHCFAYKFIGSARNVGISSYLTNAFGIKTSTVGLLFGLWSLLYMGGCPLMTKLVNKGYMFSLMIGAWCISIIMNLLSGPSPILNFIFNEHKYLALPVVAISIENLIQIGIYIPPFPAGLQLAVLNGHERDNVQTYGMVAGLLNSGCGLGSMVGPVVSGVITDHSGFTWTMTSFSGVGVIMLVVLSTYMSWMRYKRHLLKPDTTTSKCLISDSSSCSSTDEENSTTSQTDLNSLQSV